MQRHTARRFIGFALRASLVGLVVFATPLGAQMPYAAAGGQTSILPIQHGFFSVNFAEAEVGLTFLKNLPIRCGESDCGILNLALYTTAAARKGQRDLFTRLDFVPGFDVGARIAFVSPGSSGGHNAVFVGGTFTGHERDIIGVNPVTTLVTLSEEFQRTVALSVGYNHAFSNTTIVGVGFEGRREWSTPGVDRAREYCTPGTSPSGLRGVVCADRYQAPLGDLWTGQARADLSLGVADVGSKGAQLAILNAVSVDLVEDAETAVNVAVGPSIHLSDHPGQPVALLLVGLKDAFDAYALPPDDPRQGNYFADHVVFGLTLSAPFDVLVGR